MSNTPEPSDNPLANMSREEMLSALFANMVFQTTNMVLLFLGKVAHPETGEKSVDLNAARVFIDQLEMLEAKTKGNLTREEAQLLTQSLMHVRMNFVEAVKNAPAAPADPAAGKSPADASIADEPQKRFSKKY